MAMRYIFRPPHPESHTDLKQQIPDIDKQLGTPAADLRRHFRVPYNSMRYAQYTFFTRKKDAGWIWVCTSVELVAEDEKGLFALTDHFKIPHPSHLAHLAK